MVLLMMRSYFLSDEGTGGEDGVGKQHELTADGQVGVEEGVVDHRAVPGAVEGQGDVATGVGGDVVLDVEFAGGVRVECEDGGGDEQVGEEVGGDEEEEGPGEHVQETETGLAVCNDAVFARGGAAHYIPRGF